MPLHADAEKLIRGNLALLKKGRKPRAIAIGYLSVTQLADVNAYRASTNQPAIEAEVFFIGRHMYQSRVIVDGYSDEAFVQLVLNALSGDFQFVPSIRGTAFRSVTPRFDEQRRTVLDEMVLECTARHPFAELYSVIPRGDGLAPSQKRKAAAGAVAFPKG